MYLDSSDASAAQLLAQLLAQLHACARGIATPEAVAPRSLGSEAVARAQTSIPGFPSYPSWSTTAAPTAAAAPAETTYGQASGHPLSLALSPVRRGA
jgi:hypothetical protein